MCQSYAKVSSAVRQERVGWRSLLGRGIFSSAPPPKKELRGGGLSWVGPSPLGSLRTSMSELKNLSLELDKRGGGT